MREITDLRELRIGEEYFLQYGPVGEPPDNKWIGILKEIRKRLTNNDEDWYKFSSAIVLGEGRFDISTEPLELSSYDFVCEERSHCVRIFKPDAELKIMIKKLGDSKKLPPDLDRVITEYATGGRKYRHIRSKRKHRRRKSNKIRKQRTKRKH